jgi:hypothetical protein
MKVRIVGPMGHGIGYATPFGVVHTDKDGIAHPNNKQLEYLHHRKDLQIDVLDLPRGESPVSFSREVPSPSTRKRRKA